MTGAPVQERIVRTLGAGTEGSNPLCSSGESTSRAILPSHREKPAFRAGVRAYTCLSRGRCRSGYSSDRVLIRRIFLAAGQPPRAVCAKPQTELLKFPRRRGVCGLEQVQHRRGAGIMWSSGRVRRAASLPAACRGPCRMFALP